MQLLETNSHESTVSQGSSTAGKTGMVPQAVGKAPRHPVFQQPPCQEGSTEYKYLYPIGTYRVDPRGPTPSGLDVGEAGRR